MRSTARGRSASFRLPFRCIRREPSFSALVIILLAFGTATTSLLLTAIDRLLLHPINVPHSDSLVRAATLEPKGLVSTRFRYAVYTELNQQTLTFSSAAADGDVDVGVSLGGLPEPAVAHMVSASYFAFWVGGDEDDQNAIKFIAGKTRMNPFESDGGGVLFTKLRLKITEHPVVERQEIKGFVTDGLLVVLTPADWFFVVRLWAAIPSHPSNPSEKRERH
jgi:hypothetical protein